MDATLKLTSTILAYGDVGETDNPAKRFVDWTVDRSYPVKNPKTYPDTIDPGATVTLFSGSRSLSTDATTQLTLTQSTLASTRYRFTFSAGTDPVLRTDRALALSGRTLTLTANSNLTLTMAGNAADFNAVVVGDTVFIPDTTTGDSASPFNVLNTGYWTVLSKAADGSSVQLSRPSGTGFLGYSENVTVVNNAQVLAYSAAGVQVGDAVDISAGFDVSVQQTFVVAAVTSKWFEVVSTSPMPTAVSATPGAAGLQVYTQAKRWIRVEGDQAFVLRLNGDVGNTNKVTPWAPADADNMGHQEKTGSVWSVVVVNTSSAPLNIVYMSAE